LFNLPGSGLFIGSEISLIEFDVKSKKNLKIFEIVFQRGDLPEDYCIKVFGSESECILASMHLEPIVQLKTVASYTNIAYVAK
jgi:hypothetical protein